MYFALLSDCWLCKLGKSKGLEAAVWTGQVAAADIALKSCSL